MGQAATTTDETVKSWEEGHQPVPDALHWLAAVFGYPVEHLARIAGRIDDQEDDTDRREFARLAALTVAGAMVPGVAELDRLTMPIADAAYLRDAEAVTDALLAQWYRATPAVLLPPAVAHLGALQAALPGPRALENLTGRTSLLVGYLYSKLGRFSQAQTYFALAESLSRDTGDDRLRAVVLIARSGLYNWRFSEERERARALVSEAAAALDAGAPGLLRTAVLSRLAEECAGAGDVRGFERHMADAEGGLTASSDHWYGPRDAAELAAMRGASELLLGRHADAASTLSWTLERMTPSAVNWRRLVAEDRDRALALI